MREKPIVSDPAILMGRPVVAGTRIAVDELLDRLAEGAAVEPSFGAAAHPGVPPEAVQAALRYAAEALREASPIERYAPLDLHGSHKVLIPDPAGTRRPAIAVRAYQPGAGQLSIQRIGGPASDGNATHAIHPMTRVHRAGVFEALFPGETEPFFYRLAIPSPDGETRFVPDPYGLPPFLREEDLPSTAEGASFEGWDKKLGAHAVVHEGLAGVAFAVWAPNAEGVSLVGDFNAWDGRRHPMRPVGARGFWELFIPGLEAGARYKYRIQPKAGGREIDKADPYAFAAEKRPGTASIVGDPDCYEWQDAAWLAERGRRQALDSPIAIYEVHLGSWRRPPGTEGSGGSAWLNYRELAEQLIPYVKEMGYTHIEPLPVAEHPFDGSWGYQVTGFFAPTSRYGTPDDFRYFVDAAHQAGLGVILDWVPGHFPKDEHGLALFDGTCLYEHSDPRRSENREWGTSSFDLERPEVCAFLLSNALFWLERYHIDGLRADAVSSLIYLDYSRQHWVPNELGGRENLAAAAFLRRLNAQVHRDHPGVLMIAEESTAWPRVTGRAPDDSLGFDLKWNLGWMHDTLGYLQRDPIHRRFHHNDLTFSLVYAFNENFLLPFSHDEVVHGKKSLLAKMPGDEKSQFANLRALYGYMYAHPGKKLHFMGAEFGQRTEWNHDGELDWSLLGRDPHRRLQAYVKDLNRLYASHPALHEADFGWDGFQWIDCDDSENSVVSFLRRGKRPEDFIVIAVNFTPVARKGRRLGVPVDGAYGEIFSSDAAAYGGGGVRNADRLPAETVPVHGQPRSIVLTLPPLSIVMVAPLP